MKRPILLVLSMLAIANMLTNAQTIAAGGGQSFSICVDNTVKA